MNVQWSYVGLRVEKSSSWTCMMNARLCPSYDKEIPEAWRIGAVGSTSFHDVSARTKEFSSPTWVIWQALGKWQHSIPEAGIRMKVGLQLAISPWDAWIFKLDNFVSMQLRLCCSLPVRCQTLPSKFPWQERLRPGEVFVFTYTFTLIRMDSTCPTMILIFILLFLAENAFPRTSRRWWPT